MARRAKQALAKVKYDQSHPTVSFRLTKELKDRLESYTTSKGMSFTDFIKEQLGAREAEGNYEDGYEDGYRAGYDNGQKDEEARCHLTCDLCRRRFGVTKAMVKHITRVGSAIVECPYCQTESHYNFWNNPALKQLCTMPGYKEVRTKVLTT